MQPKYFATGNTNKLREVNQILELELKQIKVDLIEPQGLNLDEIIKIKAHDAFRKTGKMVLIEDTSLEFEAWNGLPGPLIKWFLESVGNEGILRMLANELNRRAVAKTALAFFDGHKSHVFIGQLQGKITKQLRGKKGFGWDPIFIPEGFTKTFAEMTPEEKNSISMRRKALLKLKEFEKRTAHISKMS